jgi:RNA polymerase sigma-70 factor (ECF subfamily)
LNDESVDSLLARARAGNRHALDRLLERHLEQIHRFVAVKVGYENPDVEDVVQETLIGAVTGFRRMRGEDEAAFVGWLLTIARFKIADHFRKRYSAGYAMPVAEPIDESAAGSEETPEEVLLSAERKAALQAALTSLTPEQEEVVMLRFIMGYDLEAVARITNRTVGAVKAMQHRALDSLRRVMGDEETWN